MSRTSQALLKLQQSQPPTNSANQKGDEPASHAPEELASESPVEDDLGEVDRDSMEAPAVIEVTEGVNVGTSPVDQTILNGKVEEASSETESNAEESEPEPAKPAGTMILNSKADSFDQTGKQDAAEPLGDPTVDASSLAAIPEQQSGSVTLNFGGDFKAPARLIDIANQAEVEANFADVGNVEDKPRDDTQADPPTDDFDSDFFSLEPSDVADNVAPVDESASEEPSVKPVEQQRNSQAESESSDEVAQLMRSFQNSPHSAVAGSTAWTPPDSNRESEGPPEQPSANEDEDSFEIRAIEEPQPVASTFEVETPPTPEEEQNAAVQVYGPRPEGGSIYHPLEALREYEFEESAEAAQLERERLLRDHLQQPESAPENDEAYWAAKAKREKEANVIEPPPVAAPGHDPEEFAESVKMHRRPAASTAFDKWLDDRFDDSSVRQACTKTADSIREKLASASGNSVLMVSSKSAKQVYQPAAITAVQLARQSTGDVLLIDGNLEARMLTEKICNQEMAGLSDALQNPKKWGASCKCWRRENLFIMPSGGAAITSYKSSGRAFASLMAILQTKYDAIIVDGGSVPDPFVKHLAQVCYATLMVIKLGVTNIDEAKAGLDTLHATGARMLGCVTTNAAVD